MQQYSPQIVSLMKKFQKDEETAHIIYKKIAKKEKDENNKQTLINIANEEKGHANIWKSYTGLNIRPNYIKVFWYMILNFIMGYTFVIKLMEYGEYNDAKALEELVKEIPEAKQIIAQEKEHEKQLIELLDEERLNYVGAMVLGLNDALVELTGTIAGLTFALMNTRVVALAGIITGVAATLSMAASNYLAERAEGNKNALKASIYTGIAYLITVIFLVLPYLILPETSYILALISMLSIVVLIIFFFNYYIAVAKSEPFLKRFIEMTCISLGVAFIAFAIGIAAKSALGIEI